MDETRADAMARLYGETVSRAQAARILNRSTKTIANMLADGRLALACAGEMVDVRSIARYIETPEQADEHARTMKRCVKYGTEPRFAV